MIPAAGALGPAPPRPERDGPHHPGEPEPFADSGAPRGHWTGLAARQASVVVAHVTPQEGEAVFGEWGRMTPSKSSLDRLAKSLPARGMRL